MKILLLEDSPIDADLVRELIESSDVDADLLHVSTRARFEEALASGQFEMVLADYDLPDFDGMSALRATQARCPDAPFIFVSGKLGEEAAVRSLQEGATDYVVKNRMDRIVPAVRRAIQEARERVKRREAERLLSEARDLLNASLVSEREARQEAEHASRMKDEFLATLSHELRTPLAAILGWSQMIRRKSASPADVAAGLAIIERNARAQGRLIEDLLDMSRIISGKVNLDVRPVDVAASVTAAIEAATPGADARRIRLDARFDPHAPTAIADAARLQQVIWNLLTNAVKFTSPGGIVTVTVEPAGDHVEIAVADTGIGIDPAFLPHVFERFRQADSSIARSVGGLGLGLSIVKQLIEAHGGSVRVTSEGEGKGSRFVVSLPAAAFAVAQSGLAAEASAPEPAFNGVASTDEESAIAAHVPDALVGLTILVIDDEPDSRLLLKRVLEESGGKVVEATSAAEGRRMIALSMPDLLISDIGMPGEDGFEMIASVRLLETAPAHMKAVALTAFARHEDHRRALRAGFDAYVAKPVEATALIEMLSTLCANPLPASSHDAGPLAITGGEQC